MTWLDPPWSWVKKNLPSSAGSSMGKLGEKVKGKVPKKRWICLKSRLRKLI